MVLIGGGFVPDAALGVAGAILAGGLSPAASGNAGMLIMGAVGAAGAVVAIVAQRRLWPAATVPS
jgi:hypothetical protein